MRVYGYAENVKSVLNLRIKMLLEKLRGSALDGDNKSRKLVQAKIRLCIVPSRGKCWTVASVRLANRLHVYTVSLSYSTSTRVEDPPVSPKVTKS